MSTRVNLTDAQMARVIEEVEGISIDVPISTTLTELQLVVERITFSGLHDREVQNDQATAAEIDLFFRDEVSAGMVRFIRRMAERSALDVLAGENGRIFLENCISAYRKIQEVQFITAIDLDDDHKAHIVRRLREVYPVPARILFSTSPMIEGGFVITSGLSTVDKSLRTHSANTIPRSGKLKNLPAEVGGNVG